jgi:hypothetical protein
MLGKTTVVDPTFQPIQSFLKQIIAKYDDILVKLNINFYMI